MAQPARQAQGQMNRMPSGQHDVLPSPPLRSVVAHDVQKEPQRTLYEKDPKAGLRLTKRNERRKECDRRESNPRIDLGKVVSYH